MHDTHFLERLERASGPQTDLALTLYRDPELVRYILKVHAVEVDRLAIALDASDAPAHVVVARDGAFVTCLGPGMQHALPTIPRARLDYLAERHVELKTRLAYAESVQRGDVRKVLHAFTHAGHRVTREAFVTLMPLATMLQGRFLNLAFDHYMVVHDDLTKRGDRLFARAGRWSSAEEEVAARLWRMTWSVGHFLALEGCNDQEITRSIGTPEAAAQLGIPGLITGFLPVALRAAWTTARGGPRVIAPLKRTLAEPVGLKTMPSALSLAMCGAMHLKHRSECAKALVMGPSEELRLERIGGLRNVLAQAVEDAQADRNAAFERFLKGYDQRYCTGPSEDMEGAKVLRQLVVDGIDDDAVTRVLPRFANNAEPVFDTEGCALAGLLLNVVARSPIEDLYLPEALLHYVDPYSPQQTLAIILSMRVSCGLVFAPAGKTEPRAQTPGRNASCPCGSGKKYKRCCAA